MAENGDIYWATTMIKDRSDRIGLYRAYYDGEHRLPWSTPRWQTQFRDMFERFRDNLCPAIVDAKADRLQLTQIKAAKDAVTAAISTIWERERLEARQGEIHKNALKDGDAFVIVWPDSTNLARWSVQRGDRMAARYASEPQGELEVAAKLWPEYEYTESGRVRWRLNLYYADRTERFITHAEVAGGDVPVKMGAWDEWMPDPVNPEDSDADGGIDDMAGGFIVPNQYGRVPVFPFPNNADLGAYGRSELKDVIPLQDALNKSVANMLVAGEFVAWPQRYLIGVEIDVDEAGRPTGSEQHAALDRILAIGNPNAKAGEFTGADLTKFIAEQDSYRAEMARISRTPLHYLLLTGAFPSGEALGAAERPLMSQIDDRIVTLRTGWQAAMSFSLLIENVDHDPATVNPEYKNTSYRDPKGFIDEMTMKKDMGVPDEQLWTEMGYDSDQIKDFTAKKEERTLAMQASFNAGTPDTINPAAEPGAMMGGAAPFGG